jgi:hypothetical protein
MFAIVLKTPLGTMRSVLFPEDDSAPQTQAPPTRGSSAKASKPPKPKATNSLNDQTKAAEGNSVAPAATTGRAETKASARRSPGNLISAHVLTTSTDSVALYSNNSTQGAVVGVLRRGTVVVPTLQVTDGTVNWILVRVPDLNLSGFIQIENLISNSGE